MENDDARTTTTQTPSGPAPGQKDRGVDPAIALARKTYRLLSWEAASALATVATVIILCVQTVDLRHSVQRDTYQKFYATVYDLDRHFLEHPELKPYFYADRPLDPSAEDALKQKVESTAEWFSDFFDNLYYHMDSSPDDGWAEWQRYVQDTFRRSSILRDYVRAHRDWYTARLGDTLDEVERR